MKKGALVINSLKWHTPGCSPYAFSEPGSAVDANQIIHTGRNVINLPRKLKACTRIASCLFLITAYIYFRIFWSILPSVFQQPWVLWCVVPSFLFKTCVIFAPDFILQWVVLLLSQYCFHWVFVLSVKKLYTWFSAHPFHSCLFSVKGGGVGVGFLFSCFRNLFNFWVMLYNPALWQEPHEIFTSVNKILCTWPDLYSLLLC